MREDQRLELAPKAWVEVLWEGQLHLFTLQTGERRALEAYFGHAKQLMHTWQNERPLLVCHDFSQASISPYSQQWVKAIFQSYPPSLLCYSANILPANVLGQFMRLFADRNRPKIPKLQMIYVNDKAKALAWLEKHKGS
jgi:hypothetical protein